MENNIIAKRPKCPKCNKNTFKVHETGVLNTKGGKSLVSFVYCDSCGCTVGIGEVTKIVLKDKL